MPRFDEHCAACGWTAEIVARPFERPPCPQCGGPTDRLWTQSATVVGDEIWETLENVGHEPVEVRSKSEKARLLKERGLEPFVRHVPIPGTDKSPHTTNWAVVSPYQLEQARLLVARSGTVSSSPPSEPRVTGPLATPTLVKELWESQSSTPPRRS